MTEFSTSGLHLDDISQVDLVRVACEESRLPKEARLGTPIIGRLLGELAWTGRVDNTFQPSLSSG